MSSNVMVVTDTGDQCTLYTELLSETRYRMPAPRLTLYALGMLARTPAVLITDVLIHNAAEGWQLVRSTRTIRRQERYRLLCAVTP